MVDVSNPIMTGDKTTLMEMNSESMLLKRQDFTLLEKLTAEGKRISAPTVPGKSRQEVPKNVVMQLVNEVARPVERGLVEVDMGKINTKMGIEPPHRSFKPPTRDPDIIRYLMARCDAREPISSKVMCTGTKSGFKNRIETWMKQKTVGMRTYMEKEGLSANKTLRNRMGVGYLPTWNGKYLDLLSSIKITKNSSAGPPYFKSKMLVWDKVWEDLEGLLRAAEGDLNEFIAQRPWLLAAECKNKADRYRLDELDKKTRPYFSINSSMQFLCSFLSQNFTHSMKRFDNAKDCWNGYGFSLAHGGGKKIYEWAIKTKKNEKKCAIYGDDVCMVWRDSSGVLWNVMPDFSQMDASVDKETVAMTIAYVIESFKEQHGENPFWRTVGDFWYMLAIDSEFWIDGPQMYAKPNASLRTGVVGTTLFDTVKSVLAYETLIHKRIDLFNEEKVAKEMKNMGLTIKPGTWNPVQVNEAPEVGDVIFNDKWLGALFVMEEGGNAQEPIPYIPSDDLLSLIGNPRALETSAKMSKKQKQRYMFDMARGYMITGAYHHPDIWNALCDIVNDTDSDVVVMRVQAGEGKGERPELTMASEDFDWPTSDGVPTINFCKNVFLSEENQMEGKWISIFPDLKQEIEAFHKQKQKVLNVTIQEDGSWTSQVKKEDVKEMTSEVVNPSYTEVMEDLTALTSKFKRKPNVEYARPESMEVKKEKIKTLIDEHISQFSLDWVFVVFASYGKRFVFETLKEDGWYPQPGREMKREESLSQLTFEDYEDISNLIPNLRDRKMRNLATMPQNHGNVLREASMCLGPDTQDPVSRVSSAFVTIGEPLKSINKVISQLPSIVEHTVYTGNNSFKRGYTCTSSKLARKMLFDNLLAEMIKTKQEREEEKNRDGEEQDEKDSNNNIDSDGSGCTAFTEDGAEQEQ